MKYDNVNPSHYKDGDKEVWEMMIDVFGLEAYLSFCKVNAFKYRMRAGKKDGADYTDDIKKAIWYETQAKELKQNESNHLQDGVRQGRTAPYYCSNCTQPHTEWQFSNND